jgi:bla regulator protein blaR1
MILNFLSPMWTPGMREVCNHLWQSTLFVGVASLLSHVLRRYQARTRYWLWMTASAKFLVPFSLLIMWGSHLTRVASWTRDVREAQVDTYVVIHEISQPFTNLKSLNRPIVSRVKHPTSTNSSFGPVSVLLIVWLCGVVTVLASWYLQWRRISQSVETADSLRTGRELETLRTMERIANTPRPIRMLCLHDPIEPGVFGFIRPVLLWPQGISFHLDDAHLRLVIAHEICHVKRRDNLTSLVHLLVLALFWFYPLVWWMQRELVKERERACDEDVVRLCQQPDVYAESILQVCEFCVSSPAACLLGVTGADLKQRIRSIVTGGTERALDVPKKLLLGTVGLFMIAVPLVIGLWNVQPVKAQSGVSNRSGSVPAYAIALIKPSKEEGTSSMQYRADGIIASKVTLIFLIRQAYGVDDDQITGVPATLTSKQFDMEAKVDAADVAALKQLSLDQRKSMLQPLLDQRFGLKIHRETKVLPVFALVIAKNGPKFHEAKPGDTYANGIKGPDGLTHPGIMAWTANSIVGQGISMDDLVRPLSRVLGRTVLDQTGLIGKYDFAVKWSPDESAVASTKADGGALGTNNTTPDSYEYSIFTAFEEQLGLKVKLVKAPVEVLVIDHADMPSPN